MANRSLDPRDVPSYSVAEAARALRLRPTTILGWATGRAYSTSSGTRRSQGVFQIARPKPPTFSFWNLVELYVLAGIRLRHGVSLPKVRKALAYVGDELGVNRPLINQQFVTDGVDLFVHELSKRTLINASRNGQAEIAELRERLDRIDRDPMGLASSIFPNWSRLDEPRLVEINPARAFGRLAVAGTGIPAEIIADRWRAGESIKDLAKDYSISTEKVEAATRWIAA